MAVLARAVTRRDITVTFQDATATPIVATAQFEVGDISIDGFQEGDSPMQYFYDRDIPYDARKGQMENVGISMSFDATQITDSTEKLVVDALNKTGAFSSGVSTRGANAEWFVTMTITIERTDVGHSTDETFTATHFRGKAGWSEGDPARWQITGEAVPFDGNAAVTRAGA